MEVTDIIFIACDCARSAAFIRFLDSPLTLNKSRISPLGHDLIAVKIHSHSRNHLQWQSILQWNHTVNYSCVCVDILDK